MSSTALLLTMVACGLLTFATRLSFILFGSRLRLSPRFQDTLRYVPPAVLSALIAPEIFTQGSGVSFTLENPRVWAGACAVVAALYTRSVAATIAIGMLVLWVAKYLI